MAPLPSLAEYLASWLARYPDPSATAEANATAQRGEDHWLASFAGRDELTRDDVVALIDWKFQALAGRQARALEGIHGDRWENASALIRGALTAEDDWKSLWALSVPGGGIYGFGPAMGSVILSACRPDRFTVADVRALASMRALGKMPSGPKTFRMGDWLPYLSACRGIAEDCYITLRNLDRALWAANGSGLLR